MATRRSANASPCRGVEAFVVASLLRADRLARCVMTTPVFNLGARLLLVSPRFQYAIERDAMFRRVTTGGMQSSMSGIVAAC